MDEITTLTKAIERYEMDREVRFAENTPDYASALMKEAIARRSLADIGIDTIDNLRKAIELYERAREKGLIKNTFNYALALLDEGTAHGRLADIGVDPINNLIEAIKLCERAREEGFVKNDIEYAKTLMNEIYARERLADSGINPVDNLQKAIELYETIREGFAKNIIEYSWILMRECNARKKLSGLEINLKDKIENLKKSIELYEIVRKDEFANGTHDYALALNEEGNVRLDLADLGFNSADNLKKATELYEMARREGFTKGASGYAGALMNESIARRSLADNGIDSVDNLTKAIDLCKRAREEGFGENTIDYAKTFVNESNARRTIADLGIDSLNNLTKAIELCEMAIRVESAKNTDTYVNALINGGFARTRLAKLGVNAVDNLTEAIDLYERSRKEEFTGNPQRYGRSMIDESIAREILADLGTNPIENLNKAIELTEMSRKKGFAKNTPDYGLALMEEGNARQKLAFSQVDSNFNINKAESLYLEAKNIFRLTNSRLFLIKAIHNAGSLKYSTKDWSKAYDYFKEAIQFIEEMRTSIKIPEFRKMYFETIIDTYKYMVFTCLALHKHKEAFRYTESSKGRTFLELLASEKKKIKGEPELVEQYKKVLMRIEELEAPTQEKKDAGEEELQRLKPLHDDLLGKIKESDPEYYDIKTVEPVSIDELSRILNNRTLVEYFLGDNLAIFVVNDNNLVVKIIEISEKEISEKVTEFRKLVKNEEIFAMYKEEAEHILEEFYKLLIDPVKEYLKKEIIIIPHSYLHQIPFQAVKSDKYLIEDYKISFAQSASSLKFLKTGTGKGALVVGNPTKNLDFAEVEAIKVAEFLETTPILRDEATRDKILKEIKNKEILHLSCHGRFDPLNPAFSKIILSDGNITAIDFMDLEMDANITVLSACETALAEIVRGDEVEGLVRAIQYAGSRFVIASLWKVDDESTEKLFLKFYTKIENVVAGIREAELGLMKDENKEFYYWAPFQVYGI